MPADATRTFPADPLCAAEARRFVREQLAGRAPDDVVEQLVLAASEIVTNAIRHVGEPFTVSVHSDGHVRIEAQDPSTEPPVVRHAEPDEGGGRGMWLVESVCDRWGVQVLDTGKCVWCEKDLPH